MRLQITYNPKPIPIRDFDFEARDLDTYDPEPGARGNCIGYGRTEALAILDLQATMEEKE